MTPDDFRRLALAFPEATEQSHMNHPDFRVRKKIFATLAYPDESWAMVKLTPLQQRTFVESDPAAFAPVKGGWGRSGATNVNLKSAKKTTVQAALEAAWRNIAPKSLLSQPYRGK
jgi:hypothetical protein